MHLQQQHERKVKLEGGQIFQGRIVKIFPNNTVALQVAGMTLTARLEAALSAGQSYWFEVQHGTGIPRLKVLDDNLMRQQVQTQQPNDSAMLKVLQQLGIQQSKAHEQVMRFFSEQQLPFSRDVINQGAIILEQAGQLNRQGFETLQLLMQRNIPLSLGTFQAVQAAQANGSTMQLLTELSALLSQGGLDEQAGKINGHIQSFLQKASLPANPNGLLQLFNLLSESGQSDELKQGALALLTRAGVVNEGTTVEQLFDQLKQALFDPKNRELVDKLWPFLQGRQQGGLRLETIDSRALFQLLVSRLDFNNEQVGRQFLQLFGNQNVLNEQQMKQLFSELQQQPQQFSQQEHRAFVQLLTSTYGHSTQTGLGLQTMFAQVLLQLGLGQENEVIRFLQGEESLKDALQSERIKSLLVQLSKHNIPQAIQEKAEFLLQRMTGQQLLATDHFGPLHQVAVQIPLNLGGFLTDLTMQWEGKKLENGQIDPEHCRILFYLQLEQLNETIVDVQIQKRYVTLQVFNEQSEPKYLIAHLAPILKEKLGKLDYQLSSVTWRNIAESKTKKTQTPMMKGYEKPSMYQGVDVRV